MKPRSLLSLFAVSTFSIAGTLAGCTSDDGDDSDQVADSAQTEAPVEAAVHVDLGVDYVQIPGGAVHHSCLHQLDDGDSVDGGVIHHANGTTDTYTPCVYPHETITADGRLEFAGRIDGASSIEPITPGNPHWHMSTNWLSPVAIQRMTARFNVPKAPSQYVGQTVFLFPSLMPASGTDIIQPVLQYGPSHAGGGEYWAIASWFGGAAWDGNYFTTALRRVSPGEEIYTSMADIGRCGPGGCVWSIAMHDTKNTRNLTIETRNQMEWRWASGGVLEIYNLPYCQDLPASHTSFIDIVIKDYNGHVRTPSWGHDIKGHGCSEKITTNTTTTNLYY